MTRKVAAALGALCLMAGAALPATPASAQTKAEIDTARDTIWTLEQSIYAGRAKGDLRSYANNLAKNYLSWPPYVGGPMGVDKLKASAATLHVSHEELTMNFVDFSMNGNTAVIYYRTHMTRQADGKPVDQWYETTHTWVREGENWHVFAGMARPVGPR